MGCIVSQHWDGEQPLFWIDKIYQGTLWLLFQGQVSYQNRVLPVCAMMHLHLPLVPPSPLAHEFPSPTSPFRFSSFSLR